MIDFVMHYVAIMPSYACTLNCKLCIAGVPYFSNKVPTPIERVKEYIDRYFEIVTFVKKFTISGGEPLLYREMPKVLSHLIQYRDRIGALEILTSGTVIPSQELLDVAKTFGDQFRFMADNYGTGISDKITQLDEILNREGIPHMIRNYTEDNPHCGGWVDFGDLTKKWTTQEEVEDLYARCIYPQKLKFALTIHDGIMYPCPPARRCDEMKIIGSEDERVDLFDDSLSVEQQREKILAIFQKKSLKACAYCNGMCPDSERFRPAEQLTAEELRKIHKNNLNCNEM